MSGAEKMDSRYIQFFCTASHSSRVSEKTFMFFSTFSTSSLIPATKRLDRMVVMVTMESSRAVNTSSKPPKMKVSLLSL